ncbi:nitrogen regulation protein NR(I) [Vibrio sp. 10N.222.51.C8]|jgi:two-component system nitrogen regulation response regulator GlnG|uniref:DNA-binding transcriptional regulator NtrC n=1 Tax=Vibrio splendidus 12E03 TaxID=1191305 RepID=A0A1E5FXY9_VIBSP|nr:MULTISPECIES: nitrogen regulation protein NR(I) [Vibrio]ANP75083.1 nitrogen regulation protein NR(I) [Vibrio crassostreae 9CS106]CAK1886643.1 DNA-binding transcriptional dual regulator NtrC [Vibrio crassostreae]MCK8073605.1 nitrogen regulation protein NR(I) [Vibrio sp. 1CM23M]MCK8078602.1 nitrogen regulation protein NR(I) [Vibrio sp. 1CM2L]MCK8087184.1 nitrogen regulation protein NR(I) [Vibrio sp. 1CM8B]
MSKGYVWVVDDDSSIRWVVEKTLSSADIKCETFADAESVLLALERETPDVLVSDIRMPGIDGIELLHQVHQRSPDLPVIIMTAHSDLDAAVNAYQKGAFEYLPKPFDIDETLTLVERAIAHSQEQKREQASEVAEDTNAPEIIGEAPAMQEVFRAIGRLSRSSISVLINGESGTGKELVAHALHRHSPRAKKPFIALNMAAIPKDLIESELFGHEKGAFTGANSVRQGRFEQANGGTLFLDEIGDMPLDIQTRLLRVLSDGQFYRVGGHSAVKVDVRIVAATHQDLERLVHEGDFREDLFHRLNVIRIHIPALRERKQDIEKLTHHFLASAAEELGVEVKTLHPETILKLNQLNWPGNVRQLENICRWLTVMASGSEILPSDLPPELLEEKVVTTSGTGDNWQQLLANWAKCALDSGEKELLTYALPEFERILLEAALHHTNGHKQDAAKVLGWGRNTLTRKLKELY